MALGAQPNVLALILLAALLPQLVGPGVPTQLQTLIMFLLLFSLLPQFRLFSSHEGS